MSAHGAWQMAASLHWIDTAFLPAPVAVARALGDLLSGHEIRDNLLVTLFRALAGLALARGRAGSGFFTRCARYRL